MPSDLKRYYGAGDLHFITFSCYRRLPFFSSARRKDLFLRSLEKARCTYHFVVLGYVVMPEHVHLLVTEPRKSDLSTAIKALKQSVSRSVLCSSRKKRTDQLRLFHSERPQRFWQPRFYDFNVFTEKKRLEKLRYIHRNPVTRGLASKPEDWGGWPTLAPDLRRPTTTMGAPHKPSLLVWELRQVVRLLCGDFRNGAPRISQIGRVHFFRADQPQALPR